MELPNLGVGIGWREAIREEILGHPAGIDWCELISEHFIDVPEDRFAHAVDLAARMPVIPHGVDLSIGTDAPIDLRYVHALKTLIDAVKPGWFSDHLCFTRAEGLNLGQLGPLPFTMEAVDVVCRNIAAVQHHIKTPLILENITYDFVIPGAELSEAAFIAAILERSDIGLLLDVTNLHINSHNHGYDPFRFLSGIPSDRIVQLHVAGGQYRDGKWFDSHSHPVPEAVFELTAFVVARAPVRAILLERDTNFPEDFRDILDELHRARLLLRPGSASRISVA